MIILSNGHSFDFCCGSGALAFNGLGWFWDHPFRWMGLIDPHEFTVVSKTISLLPMKGNLRWYKPWSSVRILEKGTINSVGLSNPGIESWVHKSYPTAKEKQIKLACSVFVKNYEEAISIGYYLKNLTIPFVELNLSCPNFQDVKHVKQIILGLHAGCPHPIIAKLSHDQSFDVDLVEMISSLPVEAIHAINTIPWNKIFPNKKSPLNHNCGVSGEYIHEKARQAVRSLKNIVPGMKIVAGGGIYSLDNVRNFEKDGADAFSIGTLFLKKPWMPNKIISDYRKIFTSSA